MSTLRPAQLEALLSELQLVEPLQLQECRRVLGAHVSTDRLLDELQAQTFLTSYQATKLRHGETDALRVGRYKLLYRNASGSFARVFRAASIDDGQIVAIKLLRQRFAEDSRVVSLFRREGELCKRLSHKNIVPVYDVASEGQQHYITMEFVEGGNFRDFIKIRKRFAEPEATRYALDVAEGLEYALSLKLTHRDLKLTNVLLSSQGVAKLVDFGLAGLDRSLAKADGDFERAIEYDTLERGSRAPDNDPRSDLYFLGAIYYELLTGQPPYPPTKDRDERQKFGRYRDVPSIASIDPRISPPVVQVVTRLMHINPAERYQTPTQVVADLKRVLEGEAVAVTTAPSAPAKPQLPIVVCVENRTKQQDALREYLTKHGFRVLVLTDPNRALLRVESDGPFGLVLIGEALGDNVVRVFQTAVARCRPVGTPVVLALSSKLSHLRERLSDSDGAKVLSDGVTLRDIRKALLELNGQHALNAQG